MKRLFCLISSLLVSTMLTGTPVRAQGFEIFNTAKESAEETNAQLITTDKVCLRVGGVCTLEVSVPPEHAGTLQQRWQDNITDFEQKYFESPSEKISITLERDDSESPTYLLQATAENVKATQLFEVSEFDAQQRDLSITQRAREMSEILEPAFKTAYRDRNGDGLRYNLFISFLFGTGGLMFFLVMEDIKMNREIRFGITRLSRHLYTRIVHDKHVLEAKGEPYSPISAALNKLESYSAGKVVLDTLLVPEHRSENFTAEVDTIDLSAPATLWIVQIGGTLLFGLGAGWYFVLFPIRGIISLIWYNVMLQIFLPVGAATGTALILNWVRRWWESGVTANTSDDRKANRIRALRSINNPLIILASSVVFIGLAFNTAALYTLIGLAPLALVFRFASVGGVFAGVAIIKEDHYTLHDYVGLYTGEFEKYVEGKVSTLNIFWTKLITQDGTLVILRNSRIVKIRNKSLAGRLIEEFALPFTADFLSVEEAESLLAETLTALFQDPDFDHQVLRYESLDHFRLRPGKIGANGKEFEVIVQLHLEEHSPEVIDTIRKVCLQKMQEKFLETDKARFSLESSDPWKG